MWKKKDIEVVPKGVKEVLRVLNGTGMVGYTELRQETGLSDEKLQQVLKFLGRKGMIFMPKKGYWMKVG